MAEKVNKISITPKKVNTPSAPKTDTKFTTKRTTPKLDSYTDNKKKDSSDPSRWKIKSVPYGRNMLTQFKPKGDKK